MTLVDWLVVVLFLVATLVVGLWFAKRASKSMADYFVAGRTLPWWLAGTSMLATSFASDTPLHVTRNIRENGLAAGWFYWNGIIGGLIVAFVFSKLWRRAGVVTDNELVEMRYSGKPAAVLRGLMAMLKAFVLEILTMAWITLGMTKIVKSIADLPDTTTLLGVTLPSEVLVVVGLLGLCLAFSVVSGFWGVVTTDVLEFSVAMLGAIVLSVMALDKVGGVDGLKAGLAKSHLGDRALSYAPDLDGQGLTIFAFSVYLGVQWWANNQVDGTGQRAQRFLACKDDQNAMAAGIWNMAVQYIIRSWPWYVAALASVILYPDLVDHEAAYPKMVADILPVGIKGLMVASFFAAFMGTIEAHYNLTASYATNDVYKRFLKKDADPHHYVKASRVITIVIAALAGIVALLLDSVLGAFRFKMELVAGLGLIYVLRWLWWRVNATTEIVALLASATTAVTLQYVPDLNGKSAHDSAVRLVLVVAVSAACALVAALLTKPEPTDHLVAFFRKVRPPRFLWKPIAAQAGVVDDETFSWRTFLQIGVAIVFVFSAMIGLGELILGSFALGVVLAVVAAGTGWWTLRQVLRA
jgi:solute:Na+ symporter, SSS family